MYCKPQQEKRTRTIGINTEETMSSMANQTDFNTPFLSSTPIKNEGGNDMYDFNQLMTCLFKVTAKTQLLCVIYLICVI